MTKRQSIKKSPLVPTVLIAGGAGFIGSHLAEALLKRDALVVIIDNFSTGKKSYVNHLLTNPKFALYDADLNLGIPEDIESVDYIFHLASLEEYLFSKDYVNLDTLLTNSAGTKNLLDLAKKSNAKFLLASTTDVYEGMMSQAKIESYFGKTYPEEKKYSLTEAKRYAEALVWEYHKKYDVNVRIARFCEIYGSRMNFAASGNLGSMLDELIKSRDLTIYGEGTNKEYYLYIDDAISGMLKSVFNENTGGNIYSFVPKETHTVLEIAFLIKSFAASKIDIKFENSQFEIPITVKEPDRFTTSTLGWNPKTSLKDGLTSTLAASGYKTNNYSFKPKQMVENIKTVPEREEVSSLVGAVTTSPAVSIPQPVTHETVPAGMPKIAKMHANFTSKKLQLSNKFGPLSSKSLHGLNKKYRLSALFVIISSFLLVFVAYPTGQTYFSVKKSLKELEQVPVSVAQLDSFSARQHAEAAQSNLIKARSSLASMGWFLRPLGLSEELHSTIKLLNSAAYFSSASASIAESAEPFNSIWESLRPNSTINFDPVALDNSKLHISDAKNSLQLAQADFSQVTIEDLPASAKEKARMYGEILQKTADSMDLILAATSNFPSLLGFDGAKNYLILFLNNNEIRPGGGFIGSYATLTLETGKIKELTIDDIYNPDGQLDVRNIKVAPPQPIAQFLTEDRLYIRNANWNPDFPASSEVIKDLFFRLNGRQIDGVIAVDLDVVKNMLNVTGPVFLTAFNEEVTAENLYERTQFNSSFNYEEGSQQKRQFLTVLGSKLLEILFALPRERFPAMAEGIHKSLNERHMMIYLPTSTFNAELTERGWDGSLAKTNGDYLQVVNANLGGTKANYYVENKMEYTVTSKTRDGLLRGELTLTYNHTGEDESWPGGPYTNYLRILTLLPES